MVKKRFRRFHKLFETYHSKKSETFEKLLTSLSKTYIMLFNMILFIKLLMLLRWLNSGLEGSINCLKLMILKALFSVCSIIFNILLWLCHQIWDVCSTTNSLTSGKHQAHHKVITHLSKQLAFHLHFSITHHIPKTKKIILLFLEMQVMKKIFTWVAAKNFICQFNWIF